MKTTKTHHDDQGKIDLLFRLAGPATFFKKYGGCISEEGNIGLAVGQHTMHTLTTFFHPQLCIQRTKNLYQDKKKLTQTLLLTHNMAPMNLQSDLSTVK